MTYLGNPEKLKSKNRSPVILVRTLLFLGALNMLFSPSQANFSHPSIIPLEIPTPPTLIPEKTATRQPTKTRTPIIPTKAPTLTPRPPETPYASEIHLLPDTRRDFILPPTKTLRIWLSNQGFMAIQAQDSPQIEASIYNIQQLGQLTAGEKTPPKGRLQLNSKLGYLMWTGGNTNNAGTDTWFVDIQNSSSAPATLKNFEYQTGPRFCGVNVTVIEVFASSPPGTAPFPWYRCN
ncbi:MAG: hypothetical protein AAB506_02650 [Patescibacteria group bacterium]